MGDCLTISLGLDTTYDDFHIQIHDVLDIAAVYRFIASIQEATPELAPRSTFDKAINELKFNECLPSRLAERMMRARLTDRVGILGVLGQPARLVGVPASPGS